MHHPLLHQPIQLGSLTLKNRLVLPPMATEKSDKGQVTQALVDYYGVMGLMRPPKQPLHPMMASIRGL